MIAEFQRLTIPTASATNMETPLLSAEDWGNRQALKRRN